ncbi:MAG: LLM class F420-dependent oxidoreductase [Nitriliruptorales bacterium]
MAHFGLQIPSFTYPGVPPERLFETVAGAAVAAEGAGFDSVWLMDHFHQIPGVGSQDEPILEGYTLLAAIAARTARVELGTMVTGVTYRNPAFLAKVVTTLDVVSSGRAILGIGAAWFEDEHRAYGFDFPPVGERMDRLEETIRICRAMFTQEQATVPGRHYAVDGARNVPAPVRPGGPPILVGGGGERRTLRIVAELADMSNLFGTQDTIRHKLDVLAGHCEAVGRDPADIVKTRLGGLVVADSNEEAGRRFDEWVAGRGMSPEQVRRTTIVGTPDDAAAEVAAYLDLGLDGMMFNMPLVEDPDTVALAGETLSRL